MNAVKERQSAGLFTTIEASEKIAPLVGIFPAELEYFIDINVVEKPTRKFENSKRKYYSQEDVKIIVNQIKTFKNKQEK